MCEAEGCNTVAHYNHLNSKGKRWCTKHKEDGAINKSNKLCEAEGCSTTACYNHSNSKRSRWCNKHKENGATQKSVKGGKKRNRYIDLLILPPKKRKYK